MTPVPRVFLPVSLTAPSSSGSAELTRLCRGCSHPPRRSPVPAASSFTPPLRRRSDGGLPPSFEQTAPRGALAIRAALFTEVTAVAFGAGVNSAVALPGSGRSRRRRWLGALVASAPAGLTAPVIAVAPQAPGRHRFPARQARASRAWRYVTVTRRDISSGAGWARRAHQDTSVALGSVPNNAS